MGRDLSAGRKDGRRTPSFWRKTALAVALLLATPSLAAPNQADISTLDGFRQASPVVQEAYLSGLRDGLADAAPPARRAVLAVCLRGFSPWQLREVAMKSRWGGPTTSAAVLSQLSFNCQLQWTAP